MPREFINFQANLNTTKLNCRGLYIGHAILETMMCIMFVFRLDFNKTISSLPDNPAIVEWSSPFYTVAENITRVEVCLMLTVDTTAGSNTAEDNLGERVVTVTVTSVNSTALGT